MSGPDESYSFDESQLATPTKVERSAVPLLDSLPFSFSFVDTFSTGTNTTDPPRAHAACLLPSFNQVWISHGEGFVSIWDTDTRRQLTRFRPATVPIKFLYFLNPHVWMVSVDGMLSLWSAETWFRTFSTALFHPTMEASPRPAKNSDPKRDYPFVGVALPHSLLVVASPPHLLQPMQPGGDAHVTLLDPVAPFSDGLAITELFYDLKSARLWIGSESVAICLSDEHLVEKKLLTFHASRITTITATAGQVWTGSEDLRIVCWDSLEMVPIRTVFGHSLAVRSLLAFGEHVISADAGGSIILWSTNPHQLHPKQPHSRLQLICPNLAVSKYASHAAPILTLLSPSPAGLWAIDLNGAITCWNFVDLASSSSGDAPSILTRSSGDATPLMNAASSPQILSPKDRKLGNSSRVVSTPGLIEDDSIRRSTTPPSRDTSQSPVGDQSTSSKKSSSSTSTSSSRRKSSKSSSSRRSSKSSTKKSSSSRKSPSSSKDDTPPPISSPTTDRSKDATSAKRSSKKKSSRAKTDTAP
jgi:hypothetical protein